MEKGDFFIAEANFSLFTLHFSLKMRTFVPIFIYYEGICHL